MATGLRGEQKELAGLYHLLTREQIAEWLTQESKG